MLPIPNSAPRICWVVAAPTTVAAWNGVEASAGFRELFQVKSAFLRQRTG
jgi:hypothetical protein